MHQPQPPSTALLPAGFEDGLPPDAEAEARSVAAMLEVFALHGYGLTAPPLMEFEESLFAGSGQEVAEQCFRVMDPDSRRMLALRADITPQIARIATTRLKAAPRPLRLSYAGSCLRVSASQMAPARELDQAGIELIGSDCAAADAEIVALAAEALGAIGLSSVSFDLTMPPLVPAVLEEAGLAAAARRAVRAALDRKDAASVRAEAGSLAGVLEALLLAAGRPARAFSILEGLDLPDAAARMVARLRETVATIEARAPGLTMTVDPVEARGFRYHTGLCFTVFAPGRHEELGRGGRYRCGADAATGITLYADAVRRAAPRQPRRGRVYVPFGTPAEAARGVREAGLATVPGLEAVGDVMAEAARLACGQVLLGTGLAAVEHRGTERG